ncbi:Uncharacterised protein [Streptococcus pneumoniae]|nr:Uncharacterised protein [Streptococcus pneumoniae]
MTSFDNSVSQFSCDQFNSTDSVIVSWDDYIDIIWISIGVNHRYNWDSQFFSFFNSDLLFMWVNYVHHIWDTRHIFDTAQEFFKTRTLFIKKCNFFLRKNFESSIFFHTFNFFQTSDTFLDCSPVCKSSTQPTVVDEVLT